MLQIWLQLLAPRFGERAFSPSASAVHPHIRGHSITSGDLGGLCSLHGYFLSCQVSLYSFQLVITYCSASQLVSYVQASSFVRRSVCPDSVRSPVCLSANPPCALALSPPWCGWWTGEEGELADEGGDRLGAGAGARRSELGRRWAEGNEAVEGAGTEGGWRGPQ